MTAADAHITVNNLTMAYGSFVIQRDLIFTVRRGDIFIIMGGSGCGKSTLLRHLIGLRAPAQGEVWIDGESLWEASPEAQDRLKRRFGVLFQSGALGSSMTLAENVALPLEQYTDLSAARIRQQVALKLALVGLAGFEDYYPSQISGGMQKRAGLARAMALDPDILFFDEPSAGLDPISSRLLDELILELRDSLGATVVVVTHELASIFAIGNNGSMNATAQVAARGLQRMDEQIGPEVRALVKDTLEAATVLLRDSRQLVRRVDARVTPMVDNLMDTSTRFRATITRMQQVMDGDVVRVLQDTNKTLQEFTGMARSIRVLTDYLERNPDSLVFGKGGSRR